MGGDSKNGKKGSSIATVEKHCVMKSVSVATEALEMQHLILLATDISGAFKHRHLGVKENK